MSKEDDFFGERRSQGRDGRATGKAATDEPAQISRRTAIQWVMAVTAASAVPRGSFAQARGGVSRPAVGYGLDADLVKLHPPGSFWPLTFNEGQRRVATALADVIIPRDDLGPSASQVGVPAFLDEWVSAPYPDQQQDRPIVLDGLAWLEGESHRRFLKSFADLSATQQHNICDDICFVDTARPQYKKPAVFFSRFRAIAASAYYGTPEGWNAIGYVGNVILQHFDGPPPEVLRRLGVEQTVH